jgi:nucleotide-binding universal stress UspA family protein
LNPHKTSTAVNFEVPLRNILFVTDFSPSSELALPYAVALASRYNGKLYLAHVIAPEMYEFVPPTFVPEVRKQIADYAGKRMEQLLNSAKFEGVPHEVLLQQGEIWDTLREIADRYNIDVLVLGTRGRRGLEKQLMGSVAEEILRLARMPVLTVGPESREIPPEHKPKKILYATDFSIDSARAMAYALSLAQEFGAVLLSVHCTPQVTDDPQGRTRFEEFFTQRLKELLPSAVNAKYRREFRVEFGTAADGILKVANGSDVDLIVMGVRGAGSLIRATNHFGTTAHDVVSEARCPVLTVRSAEEEVAEAMTTPRGP